MTRKGMTPRTLPSLDKALSHDELRRAMPPDLRGARYAKLPNSSDGQIERSKIMNMTDIDAINWSSSLQDDEEPHPLPCYSGDDETFAPVTEMPWVIAKKKKAKEMAEEWDRNPGNADAVTSQLLKEVVDGELKKMAEDAVGQAKEAAVADSVISDIVEKEFLIGGVDDQVHGVVWAVLYDMARTIKLDSLHDMRNQFKDLSMDEQDLAVLSNHILEGNAWIADLKGEKTLSSTPWSKLVYNYSLKLHQDALSCNVALNMLQETMAARAALSELVSVGLLSSAQDDLQDIDGLEKSINPPRRG